MTTTPEIAERIRTEAVAVVGAELDWVSLDDPQELKTGKSFVYRFRSTGSAPNVIAKRSAAHSVENEMSIYQSALANAPVPTLSCYALAPAGDPGFAWLLLEDAAGDEFYPSRQEHRRLLGQWMGRLHPWAATLSSLDALPDRGLDYHRWTLDEAAETVAVAMANPQLPREERASMAQLGEACKELADRWSEYAALLDYLPRTLVHNGIAGKNVQLRRLGEGMGTAVLPFDWEAGGAGHPAADLSLADLDAYVETARQGWPQLERDQLDLTVLVGRILWNIAPIWGERASLESEWPHRAGRKLAYYQQQITEAMKALEPRIGS